tara:strand:- start:563 stop:829 length:267 start_codon:yes stop_codon:yes gene_type:complete
MNEKPSFKPVLNREIAERITEAVAFLEVPSEVVLLQAYEDVKQQYETKRRVTLEALEHCKAEAHAALSRILMSEEDVRRQPISNYFDR